VKLAGTWETDGDPLEALAAGDRSPFEDFVRRSTPQFLGFFRRLGADEPEAEDLIQETFLKLFQSARTYRPDGRFAPFAFRIARNAWIDRRRRSAVQARAAGGEESEAALPGVERAAVDRSPSPGEALEEREEVARLREALATLPEHQRLVFELGVVQGLPYAEISAALEIPEGTVKSRMFHAVRRLRELLWVRAR
jgi:RNA polymerase sigma-70 factor, ECF subfamily